jgi:glycine betaine/choline ABC-type transport system substrate-binding protein
MSHPEVAEAVAALGGTISNDDMRRLDYLVDVEHNDISIVAKEWLDRHAP